MAGMMNTQTFFQSATKVVKRVYDKQNKKIKPTYEQLFNVITPDMKRSFYTVLPRIGFGTFAVKPEGTAPAYDQAFEGLPTTFNFLTYALAYRVTEEADLEDAMDNLSKLPGLLAYSEVVSKELLYWNILNLAFDPNTLGPDGQPLISNAHPLTRLPGVTMSNSAGTAALSVESLQSALINFQLLLDDRGNPIYKTPRTLWVPPQLIKPAEEILGSSRYPYTNENRINVLDGKLELKASRFITSPTAWFVLAGKGDVEGDSHSLVVMYKWQNKQRSWIDDETGNFNHRSTFRTSFGWFDWRGVYGSQGS